MHTCKYHVEQTVLKQENYGPHRTPEKHICAKLWNLSKHWLGEEKTHYLFFVNWMVLLCKTLSPFHPMMLCANFGWNWTSGFRVRRYLNLLNVYSTIFFYLLLKKDMVLHWKNMNLQQPRMLSSKFDWNWPCGSGEEHVDF